MTAEQFRSVLAKHGGVIGTQVIDTSKPEKIEGRETGEMVPPTTVRIEFTTPAGKITAYQKDDGTYEVLDDPKGLVAAALGGPGGGDKPIEIGGRLVQKGPDGKYTPVYEPPEKSPATAEPKAPEIHTLPDGSQVVWNPATRKYDPFADAKPAPDAGVPDINLPPSRPGMRIDLNALNTQRKNFVAGLNADKSITPEERNRRYQTYWATVIQPQLDKATAEANAEADRLEARQAEADKRAQQNAELANRREDRVDSTQERQTRVAEATLDQNERKFAAEQEKDRYGRGQDAVKNELDLLKYRVDPSFSPSLAGIYNQIVPGAFQPNAFQVDLPDLDAIANQHVGGLLAMHDNTAAPRVATASVAPPMNTGMPQDPLAGVPVAPRVDPNRDEWWKR